MNENLNLTDILRNCPVETKLYSTMHGVVTLKGVSTTNISNYTIYVTTQDGINESFTSGGRYRENYGECILFPSKEQRDWSKFKIPVEKFDYSTLKPFDKILVRDQNSSIWRCALYTCMLDDYIFSDACWQQGIPYNSETEHLVGTSHMPDKKYIWWKD